MRFIISIDDTRREAFLQRAAAAFQEPVTFTHIGFTPDTMPVQVPAWWGTPARRWALVQGILTALKTAREAGEDCELYEDDCIFTDSYLAKRHAFLDALPDDWSMAYQGGQLLARDLYPLEEVEGNPAVLRTKSAHRNHAWLCRHQAIERLVAWLEEPYWTGRHTCDWRIVYLHTKPDFKAYIPRGGWLCGQGANHSQLEGIDYPDRWWHFTEPERTEEIARLAPFYEELAARKGA